MDIFIDAPMGITHDHCRAVSRGLEERLEEDEFAGRLRAVDVSSPGADAPVKHLWQLTKSVGRTVRVECTDGTDANYGAHQLNLWTTPLYLEQLARLQQSFPNK